MILETAVRVGDGKQRHRAKAGAALRCARDHGIRATPLAVLHA